MATDAGPSKRGFVEDVLGRDPEASDDAINAAWTKAGNDGSISTSLIYKTKAGLGLTGGGRGRKRRGRKPGRPRVEGGPRRRGRPRKIDVANGAATVGRSTGGARGRAALPELEAEFDRLLFRVMELGNLPEVEARLREARRALIVSPR